MKAELLVAAGAVICAAPFTLGLIVARWDRFWSRESRGGPLV